jgi:cytidylate kinase
LPPVTGKTVVVALDGPAGAGKSTVGRAVARALGFVFVETGKLYRAVGLKASRERVSLGDAAALAAACARTTIAYELRDGVPAVFLDGEDVTDKLGGPEAAEAASAVSAYPEVRAALLPIQRKLAEGRGVVMEGRDIATVVFPDARYKFFLDASLSERARRRRLDLEALGIRMSEADVAADLAARDARDTSRATAPLTRAADAEYLDTTAMEFDDVVAAIVGRVRAGEGMNDGF